MMTIPLIGLSCYVETLTSGSWTEPLCYTPLSYVSAVSRSGGHPVLLPPAPTPPAAVLERLDAVVVVGGSDVNPALYGAEPHATTNRPRPERDAWELAIIRAALERDLPLLCICRGHQLLNVALGGTLHQHLPEVIGNQNHQSGPGELHPNRISLEEGSPLAAILGTEATGLCHHHQAVDRLGEGLRPIGWAQDGTVEAMVVEGHPFAIGVQWHPEDEPNDDRLFGALVGATLVKAR